jgi:CheY-like chemotaxis protein
MSTPNNSHAEILIVDDDALSRKILAQVLTSAGYNCQVCGDGGEALEMIHANPPSLLLLDFARTRTTQLRKCRQ